ncbi:MAG: hypothetical protein BMS9Abin07_1668 [Acidimicrobiia bacterium]|nr:MAG: hypothetical protein BMS9Abin07_1668 [Acidimicrobiia bacterium]
MSRYGGDYDEMSKDQLLDDGLEAMITGSPDPDHGVGQALIELRQAAVSPPSSGQMSTHVSMAVQEALLNVPTPASSASTARRRPRTRRRRVFSALTTSLIAKILVGSMALAATGGTLAATGNLPDPVQTVVADTVDNIGINIPHPDDSVAQVDSDEAVEVDVAPEIDVAVETDVAPEIDVAVETDVAPEIDVAVETDEAPEADEADEAVEADEAPEADEADEAVEADEAPEADEADEAVEADEAPEADEADEAVEADEAPEADETVEVDG